MRAGNGVYPRGGRTESSPTRARRSASQPLEPLLPPPGRESAGLGQASVYLVLHLYIYVYIFLLFGEEEGPDMPPGRQSWLFSKEELERTPSRQDGMLANDERAVRKSMCKFIEKVGAHMFPQCKPLTVNTAKVFFHRVCMSQSVAKGRQNPKLIGVSCLFLACKSEEDYRPIRELIWAMNKLDVDQNGRNVYPYGRASHTGVDDTLRHGRQRQVCFHVCVCIYVLCMIPSSGLDTLFGYCRSGWWRKRRKGSRRCARTFYRSSG